MSPTLSAAGLDELDHSTRSLGAGGAYTSIADDASAFALNPAGIARHPGPRRVFLRNHQLLTKRADGSKNAKQWNLAAGHTGGATEEPLHFGFQFQTMNSDARDLERYTLGLAYSFRNFVLLGTTNNFTNFNSAATTRDRWTYDLNVGLLIFPVDFLAVGVAAKNVVRSRKDSQHLPFTYSGGAPLNLLNIRISAELERNHSADQLFFRAGGEYRLLGILHFRGGFYVEKEQDILGYTLGSSVEPIDGFEIVTSFEDQLKSSSLTLSFGAGVRF